MNKSWLVVLKVVGVFVGAYVLFMITYYLTSHPTQFCAQCHLVEPYVESWHESPHAGVNCMHCHEMRGFVGKLEAKSRGLNYLYLTITNQYSLPAGAKIFEQNCIGCHLQDYRGYTDAPGLNNEHGHHYEVIRERRSCLECHREVGHQINLYLTPDFKKIWK
ncbi:NapC/NirT family cytochrome c [Dethiobacter alkaliphilus]|uniref:NapC/NirT cytochrome c N-terminal domain-containing protein n=1 Tax=Dethiobacter alkaliphilus AHT 1 TaxID=555088 RepID=C0GK49_DETAL|nr:NapC/NirT family cytochrome c [Dethiobacter alkaliphilus]EEG76319.1 hypothetical protein DealDRAFT_2858 [Dethiobacter alkaliphilus AHT 1]